MSTNDLRDMNVQRRLQDMDDEIRQRRRAITRCKVILILLLLATVACLIHAGRIAAKHQATEKSLTDSSGLN